MSEVPTIVRLADDAYQALRALNHHTIHGAIPAPVLYEILGHLKLLGPALGQLLGQLGDSLEQSLTEYDVYDDDGGDSATTIACCGEFLAGAADHARRLGRMLATAQTAITNQGYSATKS